MVSGNPFPVSGNSAQPRVPGCSSASRGRQSGNEDILEAPELIPCIGYQTSRLSSSSSL
jgi:hypothetical protein